MLDIKYILKAIIDIFRLINKKLLFIFNIFNLIDIRDHVIDKRNIYISDKSI
jgi:hypothetical protein